MNKLALTAGMALALAFTNLASANVVIGVTPTAVLQVSGPFAGDYLYTYTAQLDGKQEFTGNSVSDAYCIANIRGYAGVDPFSVSGYTENSGTSGGCNSASVFMAAGVTNPNIGAYVEIVYTGSATIIPSSVLPSLSFYSIYPLSTTQNTPFGGRAEDSVLLSANANQGDVQGPSNPVPEPATMTLFGTALLGVGYFARKRSKKS